MAVERKFIEAAMKKVKVDLYVHEELKRVGIGNIDIKRTPLGTRVVIEARKPGLVIGRKGKTIQMLTDTLKDKLGVDNPQLEVTEVAVPELDPKIMAKQLAGTLESGIHFRRASYQMIRRIMEAGALGVQIQVSGKVSGTRARSEKFKKGYIKHCGEPANKYVHKATTDAYLKQGIVGIQIKLIPPLDDAAALQELALRKPKVSAEVSTDETEIIKNLHKTETPEAKKDTKQEKSEETKEEKKEEKIEKVEPKETKKQDKPSAGKKTKTKTAEKKPKTKKKASKPAKTAKQDK